MFGRKKSADKQTFSDQEILEAFQAGGAKREKAVSFIYQKYMGYVYNAQKKYNQLDLEELKDAYGEAVLGLSRQIDNQSLRGDSALSTYLFKSFSNRCVDKIRRRASNKAEWVKQLPSLPDRARNMLQEMVMSDTFQRLTAYMDQLGGNCKQILLDSEYYGYTLDEIAVRIQVKNSQVVSSLKYRCLKRLRELMGVKN